MSKIVELRNSMNITQGRMAKILDITQQAYCNYEKGIRQIPDDLKLKLADYFNVSVDYLLGREQKEKPTSEDMSFEQFSEALKEKGLTNYDFKSLTKEQLSAIAEIVKNFKK